MKKKKVVEKGTKCQRGKAANSWTRGNTKDARIVSEVEATLHHEIVQRKGQGKI